MLQLARPEDREAVNALALQVHAMHVAWRPDLFEMTGELYPEEQLLPEMQARLLDVEAKSSTMIRRRNIKKSIEDEIKYCYYKDEEDAVEMARLRRRRIGQDDSVEDSDDDDSVE